MWNFSGDKPVYIQIMDEIKIRIVSGEYSVGQRLPSVRDLAEEARVNPNTMQKAMTEIEREGYILSMRTTGKYITKDEFLVKSLKTEIADREINIFIKKMKKLSISKDEAIGLIEAHYIDETEIGNKEPEMNAENNNQVSSDSLPGNERMGD